MAMSALRCAALPAAAALGPRQRTETATATTRGSADVGAPGSRFRIGRLTATTAAAAVPRRVGLIRAASSSSSSAMPLVLVAGGGGGGGGCAIGNVTSSVARLHLMGLQQRQRRRRSCGHHPGGVNTMVPQAIGSLFSRDGGGKGGGQGLTLVHFSAQRKRFLRERGCIQGLFRGVQEVSGGMRGCLDRILCQKRLRLSSKVGGCKPLAAGMATAEVPVPACSLPRNACRCRFPGSSSPSRRRR